MYSDKLNFFKFFWKFLYSKIKISKCFFPAFYEQAEIKGDDKGSNQLYVAVTSDRGLCGGIHSSVVKAIKAEMAGKDNVDTKLVLIGDKSNAMLQK